MAPFVFVFTDLRNLFC